MCTSRITAIPLNLHFVGLSQVPLKCNKSNEHNKENSKDMIAIFEKEKKLSDLIFQLGLGKIQLFIESYLLPLHDSDS